ncbi:glycosyltransferase family 8 protein, partial [Patellaria atrata CBS 101060]
DPQYLATRLLIYQLLHSPLVGANTTKIPLLILTTPSVPRRHIKRLRVDGATVLPIPPLSAPWIPTHGDGNPWLKDDLSRLHLFNLPPYDKILYLSPSTLLLRPLTPLFWDPAGVSHTSLPSPSRGVKDDEAPLPPTYLLASKPELLSRDHDGPDPDPGNPKAKRFSPSLFLFRPSPEVFTYLTSLLALRDRFNPLRPFANVLNYAFRLEGPMPWARVADGWGAEWANDED